jgi:GT2 family glycosyltransferase
MVKQQRLGFVFTNYNNAKFTKDAIDSIKAFNNGLFRIVVVDNDSDDKDIEELNLINAQYEYVDIVFSKENIGYFKGLNLGINYLRDSHPDINYIVAGNNDVLFPKDFYEAIQKNKNILIKYPVISPNIITADGFHQNPHVIQKISKIREFVYDVYHFNYLFAKLIIKLAKLTKSFTDRNDESQHEVAQEIYQGYGACYILTPKFFELFKELWAPTFLMYEEFFLSKQLSDKGYKIFYEPSIKLTHLMHATTDKLPGRLKWKFSKEAHKEYRKYIKVI